MCDACGMRERDREKEERRSGQVIVKSQGIVLFASVFTFVIEDRHVLLCSKSLCG